jgi:AcrR family transcriptional regulator
MTAARPTYHHGALEAALLEEAVVQVGARGADQVSLRGLAQVVGVSPSAVYQHFPDKAALLAAVGLWAFEELARRMQGRMDAVTMEGDAGAVARFAAVGQAYIEFAVAEPHLFRHMFGGGMVSVAPKGEWGEGAVAEQEGSAHALLLGVIREVGDRGLLRPGVGPEEGLDMMAWSVVHGFSALAVEGYLPQEALPAMFVLMARMTLREDALATMDLDALAQGIAG